MRPRWMIWIYAAVISIAILMVMSIFNQWLLIPVLVIFLLLTQGWRLFKPKDAE